MQLKTIHDLTLDEERALYGVQNARIENCTFDGPADGESALKETRGTQLHSCRFALRYPVWHAQDCQVSECVMTEGCRAPFWYCQDLSIHKSAISGAKALRECDNVLLNGCEIESDEFGWLNRGLVMENCRLTSGYPFFFCRDIEMRGLQMTAKYSFQYVENAVLRNCRLQTKDAFWHTKNVTVYDSEINGEYLGWYSEGLRLVRCRITGTQPLCYCRGLILEDCEMQGCDLSFEKSDVQAQVRGPILSVKNPENGRILADSIGELILDGSTDCIIETTAQKKAGA